MNALQVALGGLFLWALMALWVWAIIPKARDNDEWELER